MAAELEARVLEMRCHHPFWRPTRFCHQLGREGVEDLPSRMAVYRALLGHGPIEVRTRQLKG
jgi:hypothetical protein